MTDDEIIELAHKYCDEYCGAVCCAECGMDDNAIIEFVRNEIDNKKRAGD